MKRIAVFILLSMCMVFFARLAVAADPPVKPKPTAAECFAKMDTNHDGKVTLKAYTAGKQGKALDAAKKEFTKWDANHDGLLTLDEYKAGIKTTQVAQPKPTAAERFAKLDTKHDGKVTLKEYTAGKQGKALDAAKKQFAMWDTNHDGVLTLGEYKAGTEPTQVAHVKK